MGVYTTYDEKRDNLREKLDECVRMARELLDEDMWGYEEMIEDYALDLYQAIKKARKMV